jgi:hypothetical protein
VVLGGFVNRKKNKCSLVYHVRKHTFTTNSAAQTPTVSMSFQRRSLFSTTVIHNNAVVGYPQRFFFFVCGFEEGLWSLLSEDL